MSEKTVEQLFTQIRKLGQDGLHHKALSLVMEVLKKNPKDMDALKCKVVCLLKLDKCKEAYHTMTTDKELSKIPMWWNYPPPPSLQKHDRTVFPYKM